VFYDNTPINHQSCDDSLAYAFTSYIFLSVRMGNT